MPLIPQTGSFTSALTWVPSEVLRSSAGEGDAVSEPEALLGLARELRVDIAWVPAGEPWAVDAARLLAAEGIRPAWAVGGVFGRVAESLGWAETLRRSAGAPAQLASTIDRALHSLLASMRAGGEAGCDLLVVADDLAGGSGWMISPDFALDALLPSYRAAAHAWWGEAVFHSDGDIRALMPALARAGFAAVHLASLSPAAIGPACESAWSAGLVAMGGIPATVLDEPEVAEAAGGAAGGLALRGPLVVADDGGITSSEQAAVLARALESARSRHLPYGQ